MYENKLMRVLILSIIPVSGRGVVLRLKFVSFEMHRARAVTIDLRPPHITMQTQSQAFEEGKSYRRIMLL